MPPINYPIPPGMESFPALIQQLDDAINLASVPNVLAAQANLTSALGYAYQLAGVQEDNPYALEVEKQIRAASLWLNARVISGAGGVGILTAPATAESATPPLTYDEALAQSGAYQSTIQSSKLTEVGATTTAADVLPGESLQDAINRRYAQIYGAPPAAPPSPTAVSAPGTIVHGGSVQQRPPATGVSLAVDSETFTRDSYPGPAAGALADLTADPSDDVPAMTPEQQRKVATGVIIAGLVLVVLWWLSRRRKRSA